jgi:hypothetical protein
LLGIHTSNLPQKNLSRIGITDQKPVQTPAAVGVFACEDL